MLKRLSVRGFKSLADVTVEFPRLAVLFGPNAAGKSNLLDAIQAISRIGTERTLADALSEGPIRGNPIEAFTFGSEGLPGLLTSRSARFSLDADLEIESDRFRYHVAIGISPKSGKLSVADEFLTALAKSGQPKGHPARSRSSRQNRGPVPPAGRGE